MTKKRYEIVWTEHNHHVDFALLDEEAIAAVGVEEKAWNFISRNHNLDGLENITIDEINKTEAD